MSPDTWVMLPTARIKSELVLRRFTVGDLGRSVAALKVYLVIAGHVANPRWGGDDEDYLGISYTQISDWAAISRSMVGPALGKLQDLIEVRRGVGRSTNRYAVCGFPIPPGVGWAKLPIGHLMESSLALQTLSARSRIDLAALKLYLLLVTFRDNSSGRSRISYEKIREYAGVGRSDITKAISSLVNVSLISVRSGKDGFEDEVLSAYGHNVYQVHGLLTRTSASHRRGVRQELPERA